ncbi:MAG: membrane dipeptidase [Clostridiales bacterium]|nr:membrane dipeptidase [Clostridiales bacterium]
MIFDGHGDIWTDVTGRITDHGERDIFRSRHLAKFRKGGVDGGIFVIWIDPPYDADPVARSAQIVTCIKQEMEDAKDLLNIVRKFEDFEVGHRENKINVVIGLEGLSQIGEDLDQIHYFYDELGARHAMLSWNEANALATGWPQDVNRGLTPVGVQAVKRIQDLGMVMDVSHLNDKCFWEVLSLAQGPVIASHSNARALCPAMRNLTDDMIREIAKTGGLLGMNSLRDFIDEDPAKQNVERLADHVVHIAELVGVDHVGLGYDFGDYLEEDALNSFNANLDSPSGDGVGDESEAGILLDVLAKRGFSKEEIEKVAYRNFYRVFKACWK